MLWTQLKEQKIKVILCGQIIKFYIQTLFVLSAAAVSSFSLLGSVKVTGFLSHLKMKRKLKNKLNKMCKNECKLISNISSWNCHFISASHRRESWGFWRLPCSVLRYVLRLLLGNFRALGMLPWRYYREQRYLASPQPKETAPWCFHTRLVDSNIQTDYFYRVLRWLLQQLTSCGFREENILSWIGFRDWDWGKDSVFHCCIIHENAHILCVFLII